MLWQHAEFRKFWIGETISLFGSQITTLALPLTAAIILKATPTQMGLLSSASTIPALMSLFVGVWVDRLPRRRIMIIADCAQALVLFSIPTAAFLGRLRLEHLYVVAFLSGVLALWFEIAYHAFLPSLIPRERLAEGNSRLEASHSLAEIVGPGLAGGLVQLLSAPISLAVDAVSFLISAIFLRRIQVSDTPASSHEDRPNLWREIREGLEIVLRNPMIRPIAASALTLNLFGGIHDALFVLYVTQQLGLPPIYYGLYYAVGSVSGLSAALIADRLARRFGLGALIMTGAFLIGFGWLAFPLSAALPSLALALMTVKGLIGGFGNTLYNISIASYSQAIIPERLLGRYNATLNFFGLGLLPLGAFVGGLLGSAVGLNLTFGIGTIGSLSAFLWILFSPLRKLRQPTV